MPGERFDRKKHWEQVYASRPVESTSWHQPVPELSLEWIRHACPSRDAALIDVGGGASLLVDHLLQLGYRDLTVLDISAEALRKARARVGDSDRVAWIESDVTAFDPPRSYELWHDRAAFHFLTAPADRQRYLAVLDRALEPGGQAIIAAFAPDGPEKCSGLEVVRYDAAALAAEFGPGFALQETRPETHVTPLGREQRFAYHRFVKQPHRR